MGGGMTNDEFTKLCELFGFAPSRALRELLEAVEKQAFHDANINAAATILDAAVLEEREACAKVCENAPGIHAWNCAAAIRARSKE